MTSLLFAVVDVVLTARWDWSMFGCWRPTECGVCGKERDVVGWWRSTW
jgi:hypothetical protein